MTVEYSRKRTVSSGPLPAHAGGLALNWQSVFRLAVTIMLAIALLVVPTLTGAEEARRLRSGDPPEYPELAKKLNLRGVARVQVTITPDGSVKEIKELGGNPLLLAALTSAVKNWKYEATDKVSTLEVRFAFPLE